MCCSFRHSNTDYNASRQAALIISPGAFGDGGALGGGEGGMSALGKLTSQTCMQYMTALT